MRQVIYKDLYALEDLLWSKYRTVCFNPKVPSALLGTEYHYLLISTYYIDLIRQKMYLGYQYEWPILNQICISLLKLEPSEIFIQAMPRLPSRLCWFS